MKETLDSIAYKNHHNLDDKFNDYQSKIYALILNLLRIAICQSLVLVVFRQNLIEILFIIQ